MGSATRARLDRFVGWVCRLLLGVFFRRIAVVGQERIPARGPFVVVANHVNGLLDPMFVFGPLGIPARTLGKSTLWRSPLLGGLATLAGAIPVYRRGDPGVDPARNVEAFAAAHEVLGRGGAVAVFPEGTSHDDPSLKPLKTGAARIAIGAELERGPLGVVILPVGLLFEERSKFRSKAVVAVGEPLDPSAEVERSRRGEKEAIAAARALTERITAALDTVTINYSSWEEARRIELGADVLARTRGGDGALRWQDELVLRRDMARALPALRAEHPAAVAAAVAAVAAYERRLAAVGVDDAAVAVPLAARFAVAFFLRTLVRLALLSPVAVVGTLLNVVPWTVVDQISRRVREENQVATYTLFPGLVLYPAAWAAEAWAVARWSGVEAGVAAAVLAPLAGWVALRWHERRRSLWRGTRAFLKLRRRRVVDELATARARVVETIGALVSAYSTSSRRS